MIHKVFSKIEQERINIHIQEDKSPSESEDHFHMLFSRISVRNLSQYLIQKIEKSVLNFKKSPKRKKSY